MLAVFMTEVGRLPSLTVVPPLEPPKTAFPMAEPPKPASIAATSRPATIVPGFFQNGFLSALGISGSALGVC